jgi:hypothetical protein
MKHFILAGMLLWSNLHSAQTITIETTMVSTYELDSIPPTNHILPSFKNLLTFVRKKKHDEFTGEDV